MTMMAGTGSEYRRIDLLRQIPTLTGWRLSEACGWGSNGYPGKISREHTVSFL